VYADLVRLGIGEFDQTTFLPEGTEREVGDEDLFVRSGVGVRCSTRLCGVPSNTNRDSTFAPRKPPGWRMAVV
jgi:hypothetical protein